MSTLKIPADPQAELHRIRIERDRRECRSLAVFAQRAWHVLEPAAALKWGWALDVICDHLEAVTRGEFNRLVINVPPGMMKSLLVSVIWPAWEWGPGGFPSNSFTGASHEQGLAIRDSRKMRILVESEWFQERWPLALASDANAKMLFENEKRGFRQAMPFRSLTGRRSDRVIIDDPHSAEDANSIAQRTEAQRIFRETLPTRVNNDQSAIVIIMQRLHSEDVSGLILADETKFGYVHLCFPMRFEPDRKCVTPLGVADRRTEDGELLFPERFSEAEVAKLERILGGYATAGQLQQRPVPREGGRFKLAWFENAYIDEREIPDGTSWVRWWDLAATKKDTAARTAGVMLGRTPAGIYIVAHVWKFQEEWAEVKKNIRMQCQRDVDKWGAGVRFFIPQDGGSGGKIQARDLQRHLDGFSVSAIKEKGDKEYRADPFASACERGDVRIVRGKWNAEFIDELCMFPGGKFKDQVDAVANAYGRFVAEADIATGWELPVIIGRPAGEEYED